MRTHHVPLPGLKEMAPQIFFFFVFEDFFHYVGEYTPHIVDLPMLTPLSAHQALHTGVLYKHIHKIHHKYSAPFGLAAEYAHPAEVFILGAGTICGPLLYCYFTQNLHIFTVYLWIVLRLFQAVDAHSGYDFPWSLHNIVPFWSGAEHHDFHHMAFTNNFSTSFRWWDYMLGTDDKYRAYRARVRAMKKKGMTAEEQREVERKLMDEVEKEGIAAEAEVERTAGNFFKTKAA